MFYVELICVGMLSAVRQSQDENVPVEGESWKQKFLGSTLSLAEIYYTDNRIPCKLRAWLGTGWEILVG